MTDHLDSLLAEFGPLRMVLSTLEDFGVVAAANSGAILFSKRHDVNDLSRNIHASAVSSGLGIGLEYAKRTYTSARAERDRDDARSLYVAAYRSAQAHVRTARQRLVTNPHAQLTIGTYASSVAMERLSSGFTAAHILYQLGLSLEGDAVARQVLEQVAWSLVVAPVDTHDEIAKIRAEKQIGRLNHVLPSMGRMYGRLSKSTHAGIDEHQEAFQIDANDRGIVILARTRLAESALNLLLLADAWVVVWELTQRAHLPEFSSIDSAETPLPRADREFLAEIRKRVTDIDEAERVAQASRGG